MMHPSNAFLTSDLEDEERNNKQRQNAAKKLLDGIDHVLENADSGLDDLEKKRVLGPAIIKGCKDLADAVAHLAGQLEDQTDEQRRLLAQACLSDSSPEAWQGGPKAILSDPADASAPDASLQPFNSQQQQQLAVMTEDDIMSALSAAASLLRDVEFGLRAVNEDEADEIADVSLTLARLFVTSLRSFNSTIKPKDICGGTNRSLQPAANIELLDDDQSGFTGSSDNDSIESEQSRRMGKLRALWPPLGPAVVNACQWGKDEAIKKPLLAVALGFTLWPAAVLTALIGTPVVAADFVVQNIYNSFQDGPIIQGLETGVSQLYHAGKLSFLCTKLVTRQTIRVVNRQINRHGGVGHIVQNVGGMALDRVLHPVETIGMAWDGISWGVGVINENIQHIQQITNDNNGNNQDADVRHLEQ